MTELIWEGKSDKDGRKIAPLRVALPFQDVETVNETAQQRQLSLAALTRGSAGDWRNRLIWGDKKYVLPALLPEFAGQVKLIYIDPPFASGQDFSFPVRVNGEEFTKEPSLIEQKAYRDTWGRGLDSYLQWMYESLLLFRDLLAEDGSIYVHLDATVGHYVKALMDEVFGAESFQREIIWRIGWVSGYKSAVKNWVRNHDTILFYVRTPRNFIFNKEYVPYPQGYVRRGEDGAPAQGKGYPIEDVWNANPFEFELKGEDSFDSIQIKSFSKEKTGYPTQKNESVLSRIVRASSNPGDLVLDCFAGSGTTAVVAERLGRRWIACDLGRFAIHTTRKRLLDIGDVRPFTVQNLGKYERQLWQRSEFNGSASEIQQAYRRFILDLYRAQSIGGYTWLHGLKGGRLVHVGSVDAPVSPGDVSQIAIEFKRAIGSGATAPKVNGIDVLGWDFAFELNEVAKQQAAKAKLDLRFLRIPRDVMDKRAVAEGDIKFFELGALAVDTTVSKRTATVTLRDFVIPVDDIPDDVQRKVKHWSQWIDYWAIDWGFRSDTFHNEWQDYRTAAKKEVQRQATHTYDAPGTYTVVVKVIDILGNDTTKTIQVEAG